MGVGVRGGCIGPWSWRIGLNVFDFFTVLLHHYMVAW